MGLQGRAVLGATGDSCIRWRVASESTEAARVAANVRTYSRAPEQLMAAGGSVGEACVANDPWDHGQAAKARFSAHSGGAELASSSRPLALPAVCFLLFVQCWHVLGLGDILVPWSTNTKQVH